MPAENIRQFHRLTHGSYMQLEKHFHAPVVQTTTTDLQAGMMLGEQRVLQLLRNGFVVGT